MDMELMYNALIAARRGEGLGELKELIEQTDNIQVDFGRPIMAAVYFGNLDAIKLLHERGASLVSRNNEALRIAVKENFQDIIQYLYEQGVRVSFSELTPSPGKDFLYALHAKDRANQMQKSVTGPIQSAAGPEL